VRVVWTFLRWLLWSGLLVISLPLILAMALMSESGTAWLLRQSPDLMRPLGIEFDIQHSRGSLLRNLELEGVRFALADNRFEAARLLLRWRPLAVVDRTLHIQALELSDARLLLPPPVESAAGVPKVPDIILPIGLKLDRFLLEKLQIEQGETRFSVTRTTLAASFDERGLVLSDLHFQGAGVQLDGKMVMQSVAPHALAGEVSVAVNRSLTGEEIGGVQATAVLSGSALAPEIDLTLTAPASLHLRASLQLEQLEPGFDLVAEWPGLQWPPQGPPMVTARSGRLTLRGLASAYRLELETEVDGEGVPPAAIELAAQGNLQGMKLQPLRVGALDGQLQADGEIGWDGDVRWDLDLLAERIDPGQYLSEWPGRIDGQISINGSFTERLALQTRIHKLGGTLRGQTISASGGVDVLGGELRAKKLELASGPNRVYLDGRADERFDLSFDIKAPQLASLYPELSGRLEGAGRLKGTPQAPTVTAQLNGDSIAFQDLQVKGIKLNLNWQENGGKGELQLSEMDVQGTQIDQLSVKLVGTPASHRLDLGLQGQAYSGKLSAKGELNQSSWEGDLTHLRLDAPELGEWSLQAPARVRLSETLVRSGSICLIQGVSAVCAEGGWNAAKGMNLAGALKNFDLVRLAEYLPGDAVIRGELHGEFKLRGTAADPSLAFKLIPGDGSIQFEDDTQPFELVYRNASVTGRFENDRGSADLKFELGSKGRAQGRLLLGPEEQGTRSLGGEVGADFPDLALVTGFVPALERVDGRLHLEAGLSGTLANPIISGALQVENASAEVPAAGIALSDIQLVVRGDGNKPLRVEGQVKSGQGRLVIDGKVDATGAGGPGVDLKLKGDAFEAVRLPEALVLVSPDLQLQGSGPYHLSGDLLIPMAEIKIKEVPSGTVSVSDDEIIVGGDSAEQLSGGTQNLTARVHVALGEDVTFEGFGLKTGLTGAVNARVDNIGTSVNGKIELRDGNYKSYGQDLEVERGRLLFAGPPGNPDVDLRAFRLSRDKSVKAFLAVSGRLSKPRLRVFSQPALPDAEALAYLLTGNGLSQADKGQGLNIASAALSLGVSHGEPLLQQFSDELGLDELRVESGENGLEESSLILGKYLNPDLYVGYSQGLFNPVGAVLLRLKLSENLEVESRSGNEQSIDLFYRLEHD